MTATPPVKSAQPSNGTSTPAPERRQLQEDAVARFRQTLAGGASPASIGSRPEIDSRPALRTGIDPANDAPSKLAPDADRRESNNSALASAVTVGSLHYSMPFATVATEPAATMATADMTHLIEQATSVMVERASRADTSRFIVSLDHIVGGASAEFVRDGAFLHVRLLPRSDAAYRSMWTHRAELQERLQASTGLVTRVEILEGHGDGRSA